MVDNRAHNIALADLHKEDETIQAALQPIPVSRKQDQDEYPTLVNATVHSSHAETSRAEDLPLPSWNKLLLLWYNRNMAVYSNVASFSLIGCAIRIGLETLFSSSHLNMEFTGSIIPVSFFSNMVGSFILGLLAGSTMKSIPGVLPIYTGLSTGLCGSITTYSKFNQQVSLMIIGEAETEGDQYFTAFSAILLGIAAPICSFEFGQDISKEIRKIRFGKNGTDFRTSGRKKSISVFNCTSLMFFFTSWVALLVISVIFSDTDEVIFICVSIVMAPFGALSRFLLAKYNTDPPTVMPRFKLPLGTFYANFIGSVVLALSHVALTWSILPCAWYNVIKAIQTGFCACISTVSTFISEISGMRAKGDILSSHLYPFLTLFLCEVVACIINGVSYGLYVRDPAFSQNITCS